jgi:hypothetical protein
MDVSSTGVSGMIDNHSGIDTNDDDKSHGDEIIEEIDEPDDGQPSQNGQKKKKRKRRVSA